MAVAIFATVCDNEIVDCDGHLLKLKFKVNDLALRPRLIVLQKISSNILA